MHPADASGQSKVNDLQRSKGVYYALTAKKLNETTEGYLMGNRQLKLLPVAFSLVVSFESSILMLGYPAEIYTYGIMLIYGPMTLALTMMLASRIVVPVMYPLKVVSVYEYLELKYNHKAPRLLATISGILYNIVYMGINLFGPALALQSVAGLNISASIVTVAAVTILYTAIGGIKAVVWTDVFQSIVLTLGVLAVIIGTYAVAGGPSNVWNINNEMMRLNMIDFNPDPTIRHTFWVLTFGGMFRYYGMVFNQATVQRINCLSTQRQGAMLILFSGPAFLVVSIFILLESIGIFAYFNAIRCDPLSSGQISNPNQILPFLIVRLFEHYPGVSGLYIAALFSASLSTLSSGLSSVSAQTAHDFIKPFFKSYSDKKITNIAKIAVFGTLAVAVAFLIAEMEGSFMQISGVLLTTIGAPTGGLFLFSIFCPWANLKGAISGVIISSGFIFWLALGKTFSTTLVSQPWLPSNPVDQCVNFPNLTVNSNITMQEHYFQEMNKYLSFEQQGLDKFYSVSYILFGFFGVSNVFVFGTVISFLTGAPNVKTVDTRYMLSIGETFFPFLPRKVKRHLEFGLNFKRREEWLNKNERHQSELILKEESLLPKENI